ncbi:NADH-quinone oxidoreductase subunit NuoG [Leeia sp. TBRC 13508]|uniref:NADH-quinone oxidoreductase n=1 Tax=Leeia speluncae TaxID=2884804 RepID=A0ABS8D258_9NEIS|nr:NADH-quinone oxidoreductase subunit NuoG [Leeia speluncae]MCB6182280.1 NADH-quinone oxidoreductase subunit NuoG [Leeia speluncae]
MLEIEINGQQLTVETGSTVMDAANQAGVYIPHFCYHKKLSIAANCRMCLVEVEKAPKPLPACATPVTDGMKVKTHSELAAKAQKGVMEFLLINHPLDCPICDQGGECQLQDLAVGYGNVSSRYEEEKRVVPNKDLGPLISTDMTRCIHCTRCVRFGDEIAGRMELGMANRGEHSEIMPFISKSVDSELSGNMIDLCPVGALTSKPFRYSARTWELSRRKSVAPHDGLGSNIIVQVKHNRVYRVLPFENESINECWISDRDRFSYEALNSADRLTKPMIKQGGEWKEVSWTQVLEYVAHALLDIRRNSGAQAISGLVSETSTTEEMYLFNKLLKGLGVDAIHSKLRVSDQQGLQLSQGATWLGLPIAEFSSLDAALLVGSNLRKEYPLLAARIRNAVKHGAKVSSINAQNTVQHIKYAANVSVKSSAYTTELLKVLKAVNAIKPFDSGVLAAAADLQIDASHQVIAESLVSGEKKIVLLGAEAQMATNASSVLMIANEIAAVTGAVVSVPPLAGNTIGASVAGINSKVATDHIYNDSKQAYVLYGVEPESDVYNPLLTLAALSKAKTVVSFTAFKSESLLNCADVLIPVTPFTETAGSFVNGEGVSQSFNGVVKPLAEARPGWKVLRVLADVLELQDFNYESVDEVRSAITQLQSISNILSNKVADAELKTSATSELQRNGSVGIYSADGLVRRAESLQQTADAFKPVAFVNSTTANNLKLSGAVKVKLTQSGKSIVVNLQVDESIADQVVAYPSAINEAYALGGLFDSIEVERV